jgi:hypothetical protein
MIRILDLKILIFYGISFKPLRKELEN